MHETTALIDTSGDLDASQRAVLAMDAQASALVVGAPGTGKTTTLVELLADRVHRCGFAPESVLALTFDRASATRLRDRLGLRIGEAVNGPLARTVSSLAFDIVAQAAIRAGAEPPTLLTGAEQDADVAALLAGHVEDGTGPEWPEHLGEAVRGLRSFRTELRELMARVTEHRITPHTMRILGRERGHAEWVAAADFIDDYQASIAPHAPISWIRPNWRGSPSPLSIEVKSATPLRVCALSQSTTCRRPRNSGWRSWGPCALGEWPWWLSAIRMPPPRSSAEARPMRSRASVRGCRSACCVWRIASRRCSASSRAR